MRNPFSLFITRDTLSLTVVPEPQRPSPTSPRDSPALSVTPHRYVPTRNPACLWLKPNMTVELLGIEDKVSMDPKEPGYGRQTPKSVAASIQERKTKPDDME